MKANNIVRWGAWQVEQGRAPQPCSTPLHGEGVTVCRRHRCTDGNNKKGKEKMQELKLSYLLHGEGVGVLCFHLVET